MATIPLPALHVQPPQQQENPIEQYGRLLALRNEIQTAPLRQQMMQQQVQSGQIENQQRQIQLNDQQAMTRAMQQWDGKSLNDLAPLVMKNGGSANAVMGLKAKSLEMQKQYSDIAKQDAETGSANIQTLMKKNDLVSGGFSTVLQSSDADLPQAIVQKAQELGQSGVLDPQHVQMAQQLAQLAQTNPAQARQSLDVMRKGMLADSQLLSEAKDKAAAQSSQTTAAKNQAEIDYYAQNGGAPGVPAEMMQQADWLKKNPGKGPSDYKLWVLQHSPTAMVLGNQLSPDAVNLAAQNLLQTGQGPQGMYRSPGTTAAVYNKAAQMNQEQGGAGLAANKATYQADAHSLAAIQKNFDNVTAFENTAGKNLDQFLATAKGVVDSGSPLINTPLRNLSNSAIGSDKMAAFNAARQTALTEIAKVLSSANAGSGVVSDSARHEVEGLIGPNASLKQIYAAANILKADMANRHQAYADQIGVIKQRMSNNQQPASSGIGVGAIIEQNGHRYKVTAVDKNGKPTAADPVQ